MVWNDIKLYGIKTQRSWTNGNYILDICDLYNLISFVVTGSKVT